MIDHDIKVRGPKFEPCLHSTYHLKFHVLGLTHWGEFGSTEGCAKIIVK
jgi:hypothetical protein